MVKFGQAAFVLHGAAQKNSGRLHHLSILAGLGPHQPDLPHVGLAAGIGTPGPVGAHGLGKLQTALQLLHHRQGRGFGGNQSQTAVVVTGAAHRLGQQGSRNGGEATQQRLRQQSLGPIGGHIGDHNVLALAETQITTAIGRGQASQLGHGIGLQPAHRNIQPHPTQAFLLLGMDTAEIARGPVHKMGAVVIQQVGVGTT